MSPSPLGFLRDLYVVSGTGGSFILVFFLSLPETTKPTVQRF